MSHMNRPEGFLQKVKRKKTFEEKCSSAKIIFQVRFSRITNPKCSCEQMAKRSKPARIIKEPLSNICLTAHPPFCCIFHKRNWLLVTLEMFQKDTFNKNVAFKALLDDFCTCGHHFTFLFIFSWVSQKWRCLSEKITVKTVAQSHNKCRNYWNDRSQGSGPEIDGLSIFTQNEGVPLECALTGGFKFFESVVGGCVYFLCVWMWSRYSLKKDE